MLKSRLCRVVVVTMLGLLCAFCLTRQSSNPRKVERKPPPMEPIHLHLVPRSQQTPLSPTYRTESFAQ